MIHFNHTEQKKHRISLSSEHIFVWPSTGLNGIPKIFSVLYAAQAQFRLKGELIIKNFISMKAKILWNQSNKIKYQCKKEDRSHQ